jgi:acyl-CoA dehydrogenase
MLTPSAARDRLTAGMYLPRDENDTIGKLEFALEAVIAAEPIEAKLRDATRAGQLGQFMRQADFWQAAQEQGVISEVELAQLQRTQKLKRSVVDVDDFEFDFGVKSHRLAAEAPTKIREAA